MRILVCGGRDYCGYSALRRTIDVVIEHTQDDQEPVVIISGGASGADFLAKVYALDAMEFLDNLSYEEYPADWKKHGKAAGFIRNQQMIDEGKPDYVVACPGGKGTADMVKRAEAAGIPVFRVI